MNLLLKMSGKSLTLTKVHIIQHRFIWNKYQAT